MRAVEGPIRLASEEGITKVWKDPKWIERSRGSPAPATEE